MTTTQELIDWCEAEYNCTAKEKLEEVAQRLRELDKPDCVWKEYEDGNFETQCENYFHFDEGGIKENDCKFCQYCGGAVREAT